MKVRRWLAAAAAVAVMTGIGIAGADTANAAERSPGCTQVNGISNRFGANFSWGFERQSLFYAGETITMNVNAMDSGTSLAITIDGSIVATGSGVPGSVSYTFPADIAPNSVGSANSDSWVGSWACGRVPDPVAEVAASAPRDAIQAVGLPQSGSCDAVDDVDLGWGTGLMGGWKQSWDYWPNGGLGGGVCIRTLNYSSELSRWVVGG